MTGKIRKLIRFLFGVIISSILVFEGTHPAGAAQTSWLRIYANYQETIEYLEGGTRQAGYLTGSSITPLPDGHLLLTGFVKPVRDNNRRLAVLKVGPGGAVSWYRELGPLPQAQAVRVPPDRSRHLTWSQATAFPDGGTAVAFGSYLVRLDPQGIPQWTRRFIRPYEVGDKKRAADLQLKAIVRREPEGFFLLGLEPDNPLHPEKSGNLVLIATDSQGRNPQASLYQGLQESGRLNLIKAQEGLIVGAAPRAVAKILPDRSMAWARSLVDLPFVRGPKRRPDRGKLLSYQGLALMDDGDIIFSGLYDLSYTSYTAPGALICRLSPDGSSVRWTTRIHSPLHGGETVVPAMATQGENIFLVGNSSEFGALDPLKNPNALAIMMDGAGTPVWISSLGRKRRSQAKSEYTDDLGLAAVPAPDGGLFMAGTTNSFSHPKPFHRIKQWATEHCDLLLARFGPDGGLANVPQGRYPAIFNQTDPGDKKKVDVVHPPIEIRDLPVSVSPVDVLALTVDFQAIPAQWETRFSDDPQTGNHPPTAAFKVGPAQGGAALDAGASSDPDGDDIAEYLWEFPNNRKATGPKTIYRPKAGANHLVSLTVKDQYGYQSDPATREIWLFSKVRDEVLPPGLVCGQKAGYEIDVVTGDIKDAGTDSRAYLSLWGPADQDGQRCTSGNFNLSVDNTPANKPGTDLFEQSRIDQFVFPDYGQRGELDEVDHAILCHDNSGQKPGWFVEGFKVRDTTNNRDWYFVPLAWLSYDNSTQAEFRPCDPYPCGVLLGRNPGRTWKLIAASDHVLILPQDTESVFLTAYKRDQELEVYLGEDFIGRQDKNGSCPRRAPYIHPDERGVEIEAAQITAPTRYNFKLRSDRPWENGTVWIFPHQWADLDYKATARQVALLMPLEDRTEELFDVWNKAEARLKGSTVDLTAAFQGIVDYGRDSIGIFGDIPDNTLRGMTQGAVEQYVQNKLLVSLASKSVELSAGALSEMRTVFTTLTQAYDWGNRLDGVVTDLQGQVFEKVILQEIPDHVAELTDIKNLLTALKTEIENLIAQVHANDPYQCQEIMGRIKTLVAGDLADMTQAQLQAGAGDPEAFKIDYQELGVSSSPARGYPLVYLFLSHYHTARDKWGNPDKPDEYFWHNTSSQNDLCNELAQYGICNNDVRKSANVSAMEKYVPLLEGLGSLISILLNACLVS